MAHTDACKYQVCQFVGKIMVDGGLSLREAAKKAQKESDGIPAGTICRWWAEAKKETNERFKNETPSETPATTPLLAGDTGDKLTQDNVVPMVEKIVKRGMSIREAAAVLADEHGKRSDTVRRMYARAREKENYAGTATEAMQFVQIAILQLSRIRKDDEMRQQAFETIKAWIYEQEQNHG